MKINVWGSSEVHWASCLEELMWDDCLRAIIEMNKKWRIAYEKAQRSEKIRLIVDNTQEHA